VRLSQLTGAPIIPCVIIGTAVYSRFSSYYPFRAIRFGVNYGNAIHVGPDDDRQIAAEQLRQAYVDLYQELKAAIPVKQKSQAATQSANR
jgi:1-acyl-sn-glycerol-3-phosphate acyltransferase